MRLPFNTLGQKLGQLTPVLLLAVIALSIPVTVVTLKATTQIKSQAGYTISGDVTQDGLVNLDDLSYIRYAISQRNYDRAADMDNNGIVNENDIKFFFEHMAINK